MKKCFYCQNPIGLKERTDRPGKYRDRTKFCSISCSSKFRHTKNRIFKECPNCKNKFPERNIEDGAKRKYCSMRCYNECRISNFPEWATKKRTEPKQNYQIKKINGKAIYKHRWIMQQSLGRKLHRNEVIHHINGDKHDNRIENLLLTNQSEHIKLELSLKRDIH